MLYGFKVILILPILDETTTNIKLTLYPSTRMATAGEADKTVGVHSPAATHFWVSKRNI